jgi:hypothetical protein
MTRKESKTAARQARQAKALRANLGRRKAQQRGRGEAPAAASETEPETPSNRHKKDR